ncbi:MAG: hydrolase [Clostridia bacterium]|nr:hydrolase [Clostridia bacterium]
MNWHISDYKTEFIRIYKASITREGSDKLLDWLLNKSDFFTAPASTKFHSAYEGGLCEHSVKCYYRFAQNLQNEYEEVGAESIISAESVAIIALLHDVCKTNFYKTEYRNAKNEFGEWVKVPYYTVDDQIPYGHGEKSVYMISGFMRLTREEAMAINWHMGGWDARVMGGSSSALSNAFYKYKNAFLFHISDAQATYLDEELPQ